MRNRPKMLIWLPPTGRPSERTLPSSDMSPWERRDSSPSAARSVSRAPRTLPGRAGIARPPPRAAGGGVGGGGGGGGGRRWKRVSPASSGWKAVAIAFRSRTATMCPSSSVASTSTPDPTRSTIGARMKTPWTGVSPRTGTETSPSKLSSCRPKALRLTVTSMSGNTGSSPSEISRASRIMPAQVPKIGAPEAASSRIGSRSPQRATSFRMVVLSPPGTIRPDTPPRSAGRRNSPPPTPARRRPARCSTKSPCSASTPILLGRIPSSGGPVAGALPLPAADRQPLALGDGRDLDAAHRGAQALRDLGDDLRIVEVGGRLHDRIGHTGRVLALEDARADEDTLGPELHHERRVRRRGDAAGDEVDHRQAPFPGHPGDQLVGSPELLGRDE